LASCPAFLVGLGEDITKKFSIKVRMLGTMTSSLIAGHIFNSWITRVDFYIIDQALAIPIISIFFTCLAIAGLANAYNLIDGFNGLASVVALISLISICFVSLKNNDITTLTLSMVMIGAILGFLFWNYPNGKIFLGDGGAYLIGFWVGFLSILLVSRNPSVSPWYAVLVNAYPIFETLFTIWRRTIHQSKNPMIADDMHLHTLIYRRVVNWNISERGQIVSKEANAKTSPYLWVLSCFAVIPATLFWEKSFWLILFTLIFCVIYFFCYWSIVRFKIPAWFK
jgi:UDP-N-acetylmuramyl pentapeptide phosphotransferase/UDP-N-acetylglucosamine-1-phosphate transferase